MSKGNLFMTVVPALGLYAAAQMTVESLGGDPALANIAGGVLITLFMGLAAVGYIQKGRRTHLPLSIKTTSAKTEGGLQVKGQPDSWYVQQIDQVLRNEEVFCRLVEYRHGPMTETAVLRMVSSTQQQLNKLMRLGPVMAQTLHVESVRFSHNAQGILMEIPKRQPETPGAHELVSQSRGLEVCLGIDSDYKPITVDLEDHGAIGWIGPSRRGKTQSIKSSLFCLLHHNPEASFVVFGLQAKLKKDWLVFSQMAGCMGMIGSKEETVQSLNWLTQQMNAGVERRTFIVVDDLINLTNRVPEIADYLEEFASAGAGLGYHLLFGTQMAGNKKGTGGSAVENNLTCRVLYKPSSSSSGARNAGKGGAGLHELSESKGDAAVLIDGFMIRTATGYCPDSIVGQLRRENGPSRPWTDKTQVDMGGYQVAMDDYGPDIGDYQVAMGGYDQLSSGYPGDYPVAIAGYSQSLPLEKGGTRVIASQPPSVSFPIREGRPLSEAEAQAVRRMYETGEFDYRHKMSYNRAMMKVYGSRSPERSEWIREVLENFQYE